MPEITGADKQVPRPVLFGEVLFDCFTDGSKVLGGAPLNVAWHLQAFGLQPLVLSAVGKDADGEHILSSMQDWGMDTSGIQQLQEVPTGIVQIELNDGDASYDIVEPSAWDKLETDMLPALPEHKLLYHGSLALRSKSNRALLAKLKADHAPPVFLDINLRPPFWHEEIQQLCLSQLHTLKLNGDEFTTLTGLTVTDLDDAMLRDFASTLGVSRLIITRGSQGVSAWQAGSEQVYSLPVLSQSRIVDTVGAGDAFSSVCLLGECLQWSLETTLQRAMAFAATIVSIRGATPNDKSFYDAFINDWMMD